MLPLIRASVEWLGFLLRYPSFLTPPLFVCWLVCLFVCWLVCLFVITNGKCEIKYTLCLKFYTFRVHRIICLPIFKKIVKQKKKTFFIANYAIFNYQNRRFSIKRIPFIFRFKRIPVFLVKTNQKWNIWCLPSPTALVLKFEGLFVCLVVCLLSQMKKEEIF